MTQLYQSLARLVTRVCTGLHILAVPVAQRQERQRCQSAERAQANQAAAVKLVAESKVNTEPFQAVCHTSMVSVRALGVLAVPNDAVVCPIRIIQCGCGVPLPCPAGTSSCTLHAIHAARPGRSGLVLRAHRPAGRDVPRMPRPPRGKPRSPYPYADAARTRAALSHRAAVPRGARARWGRRVCREGMERSGRGGRGALDAVLCVSRRV